MKHSLFSGHGQAAVICQNYLNIFTFTFCQHFWYNLDSMWNCTISEYSFQNLNEIVWRKSEKFENEAQPSFKFFTISEDDFMKILKRVRGWVQFLINNTTWQNWACLDAAFVVRHCTYSEEFEKLWTIWEIVNNFKLFTIASLIWIKTATVTVTISAWACCLLIYFGDKFVVIFIF